MVVAAVRLADMEEYCMYEVLLAGSRAVPGITSVIQRKIALLLRRKEIRQMLHKLVDFFV